MEMKMKIGMMLVSMLCAAVLAAGCSGPAGSSASPSSSATAAGDKVEITTKEDLTGLRIGVQEGTTGDDYSTNEVADSKVSRYKNAIDAMIDLENGKLDAVIWDELPSQRAVSKRDKLKIVEGLELTEEQYSIAVQKGNTELLESINKSINRMKEDGTLDAITAAFKTEDEAAMASLPEIDESGLSGELVMGTNAMFEPFEYRKNNEVVGFDVEMGKQIAKDMGKKLKVEDMDFGGIIAAVQTGKVDIGLAGMTANDERRESVDFSEPYFTAQQVVVVRK